MGKSPSVAYYVILIYWFLTGLHCFCPFFLTMWKIICTVNEADMFKIQGHTCSCLRVHKRHVRPKVLPTQHQAVTSSRGLVNCTKPATVQCSLRVMSLCSAPSRHFCLNLFKPSLNPCALLLWTTLYHCNFFSISACVEDPFLCFASAACFFYLRVIPLSLGL